ncbi:MAG: type II toxin-antitoxin system HipA family toxin [Francisellaceae bacterium]|nr:type II toxin-antitoxin system HipA family toxin [Francisellaceae bacterium]
MSSQVLDVYLLGRLVGKFCSDNATLSFVYDPDYVCQPNALKLSASLPLENLTFSHQITSSFFSGLLPDEGVRQRLAAYLGLSEKNTFALLKEVGGECAGAVSVYPEGVSPNTDNTPTYRVLENDEADSILMSLARKPFLAGDDDIRISGAGAQDKLMISFVGDKIAIPTGSTPSTHIIKPAILEFEDTVYNEFFCMKLAKAVGLVVPDVDVYWVKRKPYYLIERYDRSKQDDGKVIRLHQEDFCQAMHIAPEIKYESEGGPTLNQCFSLLDDRIQNGFMGGKNKLLLLQGVIFNFLIGNGDAHGKNFSMLYKEEEEELAPLYDLLCTVIYSNPFKVKMAMKLSGKYKFREVSKSHWIKLGKDIGFRVDFVENQLLNMSNKMLCEYPILISKLNENPKTVSPIYERIGDVIYEYSRKISM